MGRLEAMTYRARLCKSTPCQINNLFILQALKPQNRLPVRDALAKALAESSLRRSIGRNGREVEGVALEMRCGETHRGFESHFLLQSAEGKINGEVTERPKVHDWKSCVGQPTEGSNPSPSAILFLIPQGIERSPNRERSFFDWERKGMKTPPNEPFLGNKQTTGLRVSLTTRPELR